ncbi:MAG TPA: hypothetical protein VJM83_02110 [Nitrospirota bacterium]|nr:hypothetical protein [Nitrospirota bacterium]
MKKVLLLSLFLFAAAGLVYANASFAGSKSMTMEGYVVDTKCADANKANIGEFVKTHAKDCAMAPDCHKSGYNLYSEGKLWKFDKESSDKVYKFIEKADSTLKVKAEVVHGEGDMVKLVKIENAK